MSGAITSKAVLLAAGLAAAACAGKKTTPEPRDEVVTRREAPARPAPRARGIFSLLLLPLLLAIGVLLALVAAAELLLGRQRRRREAGRKKEAEMQAQLPRAS